MSSTILTLRRMANDIARNLAAMGHDQAVLATADHIDKFWDPRMKKAIFADGGTDLSPIAARLRAMSLAMRRKVSIVELTRRAPSSSRQSGASVR